MNLDVLEQKIDVAIADYLVEAQSQALQTVQRKLLGHSPKKNTARKQRRKLNKTRTKADIAELTELRFQACIDAGCYLLPKRVSDQGQLVRWSPV